MLVLVLESRGPILHFEWRQFNINVKWDVPDRLMQNARYSSSRMQVNPRERTEGWMKWLLV